MNTILIVGRTPESLAAEEAFRAAGYHVYAADIEHAPLMQEEIKSKEDKLDLLVFAPEKITQDGDIYTKHDPDDLYGQIEHNALGFYRSVENCRELLGAGKKRICVLTSRSASIRKNTETEDYGYHMSLAAVNMIEKIFFNMLRPEGFTFRCFAADGSGGLEADEYFSMDLCYDKTEPYIHSDENRLVFRDRRFDEIAW